LRGEGPSARRLHHFETIGHVGEQKAAGKTLEEAREEGLPDRFALWNRKPRFVSEKK
jgi:hypothetical protein